MPLKHPIRCLSAGFNHAGSRPVAQEIRLPPHAVQHQGGATATRAVRGVLLMRPLGEGQLMRRPPSPAELAPLRPSGVTIWAQALIKWGLSDPRVRASLTATSRPGRRRTRHGDDGYDIELSSVHE